jgi:RecG-like helicase
MRKALLLALSAAGLLLMTTATRSLAADSGKTITITGEGKCAKCAMKESDTCQNVIQTKEDGKTVTYYLVQNKVSKGFHSNLCKGPKKVTATGTIKEVNGKQEFVAKEIKVAE